MTWQGSPKTGALDFLDLPAGSLSARSSTQRFDRYLAGLLEVYAKVMERKRDTGELMDAPTQAPVWAQEGTSDAEEVASVLTSENEKAA